MNWKGKVVLLIITALVLFLGLVLPAASILPPDHPLDDTIYDQNPYVPPTHRGFFLYPEDQYRSGHGIIAPPRSRTDRRYVKPPVIYNVPQRPLRIYSEAFFTDPYVQDRAYLDTTPHRTDRRIHHDQTAVRAHDDQPSMTDQFRHEIQERRQVLRDRRDRVVDRMLPRT